MQIFLHRDFSCEPSNYILRSIQTEGLNFVKCRMSSNKLCRKFEAFNRVRGFWAHSLEIEGPPDDSTAAQDAILKVAV